MVGICRQDLRASSEESGSDCFPGVEAFPPGGAPCGSQVLADRYSETRVWLSLCQVTM